MTLINPQFCPGCIIMLQGSFWNFTKLFRVKSYFLSNWRTKLKVLHSLIYTVILSIIHMLFCSESRNMLQGPICNFSKVRGLNCNFRKLRDQIEFSSSSTSNPEFQQITYCYPLISNINSQFKQNHNSKSS